MLGREEMPEVRLMAKSLRKLEVPVLLCLSWVPLLGVLGE